ncbi:MAG TPA: tetraprenyl-beta-curcumene synthase family protein [Bacilli bacterium]
MFRFYRSVLPEVRSQLAEWRELAMRIPTEELRKQAIASLSGKQFHCEGGAVYAAFNLAYKHVLIPLIVAFQTISDYLDNLCDRSTSLSAKDFRQMHQAMLDAVDPAAPLHDYYAYHPEQDDGGYLDNLVKTCQSCICMLPSYDRSKKRIVELVSLYCDLQVFKHISLDKREKALKTWWKKHKRKYRELRWNEFAAATGSTLGVFMLFAASADKFMPREMPDQVYKAYFPYVCGLHILLDYLIDQDEDRRGGDLNFCAYYAGSEEKAARISWVAKQARKSVKLLQHVRFHRMVIEGLLALYLSDPKVRGQSDVKRVSRKLMWGSPLTRVFFWFYSIWIRRRRS